MDRRFYIPPKVIGASLAVCGGVLAATAALADVIGLGGDPTSFGYKQIIGTSVGLMCLVVGVALLLFGTAWPGGRNS